MVTNANNSLHLQNVPFIQVGQEGQKCNEVYPRSDIYCCFFSQFQFWVWDLLMFNKHHDELLLLNQHLIQRSRTNIFSKVHSWTARVVANIKTAGETGDTKYQIFFWRNHQNQFSQIPETPQLLICIRISELQPSKLVKACENFLLQQIFNLQYSAV